MELLEPGIYHNISFSEYLALPYVSNSYLKRIKKCPAAGKVSDKDTAAKSFGRAAHTLVLEGEAAFNECCISMPEGAPKRPTEAQINAKNPSVATIHAVNWWDEFSRVANGKCIVSADDMQDLKGIQGSVYNHPFAKLLLADGVSEMTVIFDVEVKGQIIRCKSRPDRTPSGDSRVLVDLKTADDVSYDGFIRACRKWGYFQQAAMYIDGYNAARKALLRDGKWDVIESYGVCVDYPEMDAFAFIAVEKKEPYQVEVYTLTGDNSFLIEGREQYQSMLLLEAECRQRGAWPAYQNAGCQELVPYSERSYITERSSVPA